MKLLHFVTLILLSCGTNNNRSSNEVTKTKEVNSDKFDEFIQKCNAKIDKNSYFRIVNQVEQRNPRDTVIKDDILTLKLRYAYSKWKVNIDGEAMFLDVYFWENVDDFQIQQIESAYFIEKKFNKSKKGFKVDKFYCVVSLDKSYSKYKIYLTQLEVFLLRNYIEVCSGRSS